MTLQTKNTLSERDRKMVRTWLRVMIVVLLLGPPAYVFMQAGHAIDLNRNLLEAIRRNDAPTVAFLLSAGADANARDSQGETRPMLRQILDRLRGIPTPPGLSALLVSLEEKPDKKIKDAWVYPPENIKIIQSLLDHHADPNAMEDGSQETPLMKASAEGKTGIVRLLLDRGAKVDKRASFGTDALQFAALYGNPDSVRLLLDAGADVNSRDANKNTALMHAIVSGNIPTVKLLIVRGADVNARDSAGDSTLAYAMGGNVPALVTILKAAGAK